MEQNLVSDVELIKRINDVLNDSKEDRNIEEHLENSSAEKFHDVSDSVELQNNEQGLDNRRGSSYTAKTDLELENQLLASQLEAERRKSRELQLKFQLFENSVKYFERLNGQLETLRQTVEEDNLLFNEQGDFGARNSETMQKLRPKTVHTATNSSVTPGQDDADDGAATSSEPQNEDPKEIKSRSRIKRQEPHVKDEIAFRDAEDFKQLEQDLEIVKDKECGNDLDAEKVFITKTEKKCLEDIGHLASRMRTPLDDKHQKYFEKDRRRFPNRIIMPETQEVDKTEQVPVEMVSKTKVTPVNITSTEMDGLRSYLLQLKELIARRETAWARTTERDYNQRVEITRFKNEVSHLRMLCEKRQKDIKERDQIIIAKDEEIRELQKKVQSLKSTLLKLEKKDDRFSNTLEGLTNEILENSQLVQRSYSVMKRATMLNKGANAGNIVAGNPKTASPTVRRSASGTKHSITKRSKPSQEKMQTRKIKSNSSNSNDEEVKSPTSKIKSKSAHPERGHKVKHRNEGGQPVQKKTSIERVDEKLQRIEEMLHSDVLKGERKGHANWRQSGKLHADPKAFLTKGINETDSDFQKFTPSNSKIRQEVLGAMTGLNGIGLGSKPPTSFSDPKKQGNAAILANALLAARSANMFNF